MDEHTSEIIQAVSGLALAIEWACTNKWVFLGYMLPNDNVRANQTTLQCQHQLTTVRQDECERLNLQHIIISALMRGKLYLAPLQTDARNAPRRILDMGCGTGIWCTEMGMKFSLATRVSILLTLHRSQGLSENRGSSYQ